jgi:very-short-patch-repair endonuclease
MGSCVPNSLPKTAQARQLRRNQTTAEGLLWSRLRNRGLNGFKFVRQEPVGPYIVDMACRSEKLVIEIDGATHSTDGEVQQDQRRTDFLGQAGYRVLRVTNAEIYENLHGVLETILAALERRDTI